MYFTWFDYYLQNDAVCPDIKAPSPVNIYPNLNDISTTGHKGRYWGTPELGLYKSTDVAVIDRHAQQLSDAGVDFISIDLTNSKWSCALDESEATCFERHTKGINCVINSTVPLLKRYAERQSLNLPTPKVVLHMNMSSYTEDNGVKAYFLDQKVFLDKLILPYQSVFFKLAGKPLAMVHDHSPQRFDLSKQLEVRITRGMDGEPGRWSFLDLTPQILRYSASSAWPEEMAVSAAQQTSYMNGLGARGRNWSSQAGNNVGYEGQNFDEQWDQVYTNNPTFIYLKSWNEWIANSKWAPASEGHCKPADITSEQECLVWSDQFSPQFSGDIEPFAGSHGPYPGNYYLTTLKNKIARFKRNSPNFVIRNDNGTWYFKTGRGGERFGASNFSYTFNWANGAHYQPIVDDFNNDGLTDIALRDSSNGAWHFAYARGDGTFSHTDTFNWAAGANYDAMSGDFNQDGWPDIVLRDSSTGQWHFAFSHGNGTYSHTLSFKWDAGTQFQPLVGDYNGDGLVDIVMRNKNNGIWFFAFNNGNGTFSEKKSFGWSAGAHYQAFAGDFDCDGLLDIGLRDTTTGKLHLANANSSDTFSHFDSYAFLPGGQLRPLVDPKMCR